MFTYYFDVKMDDDSTTRWDLTVYNPKQDPALRRMIKDVHAGLAECGWSVGSIMMKRTREEELKG